MINSLSKFIREHNLFDKKDKILLALSGGVDSMVLCDLFLKSGLSFGIAHCNFKLRDEASDDDERLVLSITKKHKLPFFVQRFHTKEYAKKKQLSIQEAARDLRYEWLEKIRLENDFQYIATAHHLNDSIETVIYNFAKGTGIRGLHGILPKNGLIIRPLLFAKKEAILSYAQKNMINYREDESNHSDKYQRNFIRHHLVPNYKEINPNFEKTSQESIQHFRDTELIFDFAIAQMKENIVKEKKDTTQIDIKKLLSFPAPKTVLYEILKAYHFHLDQVQQIMNSLGGDSGKQFLSSSHHLIINRGHLLIQIIDEHQPIKFQLDEHQKELFLGEQRLEIERNVSFPYPFPTDPSIAFLDGNQLQFPMTIRKWKDGDRFKPLGMKGKSQKLKDFFTNAKLSLFDKKKVWLLESDGKIVWIIGHRLDERFKIHVTCKDIIKLKLSNG